MQLRIFIIALIVLYANMGFSQSCNACETVNLDGSAFPSGLVYQWTCTDGQTSTLQSPTLSVTQDMTCTLVVTDTTTGCVATRSIVVNNCPDTCNVLVNVDLSGTIYLATAQNCVGTPTYQWQRKVSGVWTNVGTNSATYNTNGISSEYKVIVTCEFGCSGQDSITYSAPCNGNLFFNFTTGNTGFSGYFNSCNDTVTYTLFKETFLGSGVYDSITTKKAFNISVFFPYTLTTVSNFRMKATCGSCIYYKNISFNPCSSFSVIGGPTNQSPCLEENVTAILFISGGNDPYIIKWSLDGDSISNNDTVIIAGFEDENVHVLTFMVTDSVGCVKTGTSNIYPRDCCPASNTISPLNSTICTNTNITYTASGTGTPPYTFQWTSKRGSDPIVSQGSGSSKVLNFSQTGTYVITAQMTDADGCISSASTNLSVQNCANCTCAPSLSLSGCQLIGTFTGGGCTGFTYELQRFFSGVTWNVVQTGAASNFIYNPTFNGTYRILIYKDGCAAQISNSVTITCYVPPCSSQPTLTLNGSSITQCGLAPITISSNTFGGSATSVTLTENGTGSLSSYSESSSPFSFTYTPTAADYYTTVTITVITNNPNGPPCVPQTKTFAIQVLPTANPAITSSSANMCKNTTRLITATPAGGTFSVTSGFGAFSGNTLTANDVGVITIQYTVTTGCSGSTTQSITVDRCDCDALAMTITPNDDGTLDAGSLFRNGVTTNNYRIEWRNVNTNAVVFTSGKGSGLGGGAVEHPFTNQFVGTVTLRPVIVFSPEGNNLTCFEDIQVCEEVDIVFEPLNLADTILYLDNYAFTADPADKGYPLPDFWLCEPLDGFVMQSKTSGYWDAKFTSDKFVTWSITSYDSDLAPNVIILNTTSTVATIRFLCERDGPCPEASPGKVLGGCWSTSTYNYAYRVKATNECGVVVYDVIIANYTS